MPEIVQEIGAYAGLASVVGLAVLSALFFSQARDVKRLREWAGRAPERADAQAPAVPGRTPGQLVPPPTQARPGAPVVPGAATAAASTGARPAAAPVPGATPGPATPAARPGQPAPAASGAAPKPPGGAVPVPAAASATTAAPAKPSGPGQNAGAQSASPPPAQGAPAQGAPVANSGSPSAGAQKAATPSAGDAPPAGPATPAGERPPAAPPVPPPARAAPPAAPGGSGGPTRPGGQPTAVIPPPRKPPWYRRLLANPLYAVLVVAGVLILGGAAAFGVTQLASDGEGASSEPDQRAAGGSSGEDPQAGNGEDSPGNGGAKVRKGGAVKPGNVTVAVLNGTTVPGLAATLADQVTAAGFRAGTIANFGPNQQLAESVVQYASGHEREAAAVSRKLGIGQRETASAESRELAGDATVIVIAGGDKAP